VIQALLGHATLDTIMVYAKLYPTTLIEEYRKAVRGLYNAFHGDDSLRNPTADEWAAFTVSCNLRDMGTHLCALPTGESCPEGLLSTTQAESDAFLEQLHLDSSRRRLPSSWPLSL